MLLLYICTHFLLFSGNYKHMHGSVSITSSFKELCLESEVMFYSEFSKVTLFPRKFRMLITLVEIRRVSTWNRHMVWTFFTFSRTATEGPYETRSTFCPAMITRSFFFWRVAQLPTTSASHCRCFLILMSLPLSMRLTPLVHGFSPLVLSDPLDTFRQIATTWPRQQRISLVGSGTDPRNTFPECVEKGSRLGSPGGEVFVSKNKQIRASVQRKCWIVCEGKMGTKQHR
jgi:hypothetical protein